MEGLGEGKPRQRTRECQPGEEPVNDPGAGRRAQPEGLGRGCRRGGNDSGVMRGLEAHQEEFGF